MRSENETGRGAMGRGAQGRQRLGSGLGSRGSGAELFALFFFSLVLLVLSRLDYDALRQARDGFADYASPVLEAASVPAVEVRRSVERLKSYVEVFDELERLRQENQRLKHWEWQAKRLERRIGHMRALLKAVEEPALDFATARVIAEARGPFARTVLVNIGHQQGVKPGFAVVNADGVVGRVVHVAETASRVVLLNDLNSRIPVLVGPRAMRAVLAGNNANAPRLEFVSDEAGIYTGDEVYTSGDDGLLPRGLRIGTVASASDAKPPVRLAAQLDDLEYVSILFFNSPDVPTAAPAAQPLNADVGLPTKRSAVETGRAQAQ